MQPFVLFVGEDAMLPAGPGGASHDLPEDWRQGFARDGREALEMMGSPLPDVVVSGDGTAVMLGLDLLQQMREQYPATIRILLSSQARQLDTTQALNAAQLTLQKPCDPGALQTTIQRVLQLRETVWNERVTAITGNRDALPAFPASCAAIQNALRDPDVAITDIADLINEDAALAAGVLRLVNSPFFGLRWPVKRMRDAVIYVGLAGIEAIVLNAALVSVAAGVTDGIFGKLQRHSFFAATVAAELADAAGENERAYLAGLVHDAGVLMLCSRAPKEYALSMLRTRTESLSLSAAEQMAFAVSHEQVGAALLDHWGLPHEIVEAVAFHHDTERAQTGGLPVLSAVHVADRCATELGIGLCSGLGAAPSEADEEPGWFRSLLDQGRAMASVVAESKRFAEGERV